MIKSLLAKPFAAWEARRIRRWSRDPRAAQRRVLEALLRGGRNTAFGREHGLADVDNAAGLRQAVPLRDYESLRPWIDRVKSGESDVLWPGRPAYFAKTSGTTSGAKYIPISRESIPNHIVTARMTLTSYIHHAGRSAFADGKMIFLQGSPVLGDTGGIPTGRLSGLVYHHVPAYLLRNRMPSYETNCIEDWEAKVEAICRETAAERMTLISGIPPWVVMYFEQLLEMTGRSTVREVFPDFDLFVHGGVNYRPYAARIDELTGASPGRPLHALETYPTSEGFLAFQDRLDANGLLLNVESGIFFEFVPLDRYGETDPPRLTLEQVEAGPRYAVILHTNAGLWGYRLGDTVRFTSLEPARIVVTGRTEHFISAFGEHVIAEEVEGAMARAITGLGLDVAEFTVAPAMAGGDRPARHEWWVEFAGERAPDLRAASDFVDRDLRARNSYYDDLREGGMLAPPAVIPLRPGAFADYQRAAGKLGGQNKVARLANNHGIADALEPYRLDDGA